MDSGPAWLITFHDALLALDEAIDEFSVAQPTPEAAAEALEVMHEIKYHFGFVYDHLQSVVIHALGSMPEIVLSSGTKIEQRQASNRKSWQHQDLAEAVAKRISNMGVDVDTGERLLSTEDMIVKVLDYVQPSYWRVGKLNEIGISADHYCEVSEGGPSLIVRKAKRD